jgi:hypothetical protein
MYVTDYNLIMLTPEETSIKRRSQMTTQRWTDEMLDSLAGTVQVDYEQDKRENDNRFNTLLEEVRFLIRQLGENR